MSAPLWSFAERSQNDVEQEVTETDQFNSETVDLSETLVRESAQNSQDARAGDAPVRIRFDLASPSPDFIHELAQGLIPRLEASGFGAPLGGGAMVIEDFGTTGLTGPVDDHTSTDNFRSFFFRHGGSFKAGSQNGRWGLGKLVFPMSSSSRCFFGLTRRVGEDCAHLLGEAVLRTHHLGGRKYAPHGHFGRMDGGHVLPVSDPAFIDRFSREFGLHRTTQPGLSVVIPWPAVIPDREELTRLVARNYLWPILSGSLVVDVMGREISRATIATHASGLLPSGFLDFVEGILNTEPDDLPQLREPVQGGGGVWEAADALVQPDGVDAIRKHFAEGHLTGFRIPVPLGRKQEHVRARSAIRVFLKKAPDGVKGEALYVRRDITVPDEARKFRSTEVYAAMVADRGEVAEFLADAENPAHTSWNSQAQRLKAGWKYPHQTLSFIRNAPVRLHQLLTTGLEAEVRNALLDFFWIDEPHDQGKGGGKDRRKGQVKRAPAPDPLPPDPKPRRIRIDHEMGGFTVRGEGALARLPLPQTLRLRLGYDVEGGNAVRDWQPYDFNLIDRGQFRETVSGASVEAENNEIRLEITDPAFGYTLTGFDPNRDLVVEAAFISGR